MLDHISTTSDNYQTDLCILIGWVKSHFWKIFTTHFTLLYSIFTGVWPKKDSYGLRLISATHPCYYNQPLQLVYWPYPFVSKLTSGKNKEKELHILPRTTLLAKASSIWWACTNQNEKKTQWQLYVN